METDRRMLLKACTGMIVALSGTAAPLVANPPAVAERKQVNFDDSVHWMEAANPPAVAERKPREQSSDFIRRYGSSAFRQMASQLAYSPDGRWLAAESSYRNVFLIDAKTGETKWRFPAKQIPIIGFVFSPDGRSVAVIDRWGVTVWDANQGTMLRQTPEKLNRNLAYTQQFVSSPDRQWRAALTRRKEILLTPWDQADPLHKISFKSFAPFLAMGNAGKWVAAGDISSRGIQVWKAPKFDSPMKWEVSNAPLRSLASSPDGQTVYAGSADGSVHAWNVKEGRETSQFLRIHRSPITSLVVSPNGKYLAAATSREVTIYEATKGWIIQNVVLALSDPAISLVFSPDGSTLAIGSRSRPIELWDVETGQAIHRPSPTLENVFATPDRRLFGSFDQDTVRLWNRSTGEPAESFSLRYQPKGGLIGHGAHVLSGTEQLSIETLDGEVFYRDLASGQADFESLGRMPNYRTPGYYSEQGLKVSYLGPGFFRLIKYSSSQNGRSTPGFQVELKGSASRCLQFEFSEDGQILAAAFADRSVFVWESQTGKQLHRLQLDQAPKRMLLNSNSRWLAVSHENSVDTWDLKAGKRSHQFPNPKTERHVIAFGWKESLLAISSPGEPIRLWNLETGKESLTLPSLDSPVEALAFSPDDKRLALGYQDKTIRLLDLNGKQAVLKLEGHSDHVTHLRFHPEGSRLLSGSKASEVFVWDATTGKQLSVKKSLPSGIQELLWSADGKQVIVLNESNVYVRFPAVGNAPLSYSSSGMGYSFPKDFAYCKQTEFLAVAYDTGIRTLDRKSGRELPLLREDNVSHVEWAGDGRILMAASRDLFGWDVDQQKEVYRIPQSQLKGPVTSMVKSPDGRMVATGQHVQSTCLWDPQTGRLIRKIPSPNRSYVESLQFSPDGRLLFGLSQNAHFIIEVESGLIWFQKPIEQPADKSFALMGRGTVLSGELVGTARLWSWAPTAKDRERLPPEKLWDALSKNDGPTVYQSMFALADWGDETVAFLTQRLPTGRVPPIPPEKVASLINDLEHDSPAIQRRASEELRELGSQAHPRLQAALLNENLPARVRARIQLLLSAQSSEANPELLAVRAVQLLEWIATPKAQTLLQEWANNPTDHVGSEAQAASRRLSQLNQ